MFCDFPFSIDLNASNMFYFAALGLCICNGTPQHCKKTNHLDLGDIVVRMLCHERELHSPDG